MLVNIGEKEICDKRNGSEEDVVAQHTKLMPGILTVHIRAIGLSPSYSVSSPAPC